IDVWRELDPALWESEFTFPRASSGEIVKSEIPNERPSGIMGLVMNTRSPLFSDWRVRQAMIEAFNWDFINDALSGGEEQRITSYFANSALATPPGTPAEGRTRALLEPFADTLLPGALDGYTLPEGSDQPLDRRAMRRALALFEDAGWTVQNGVLSNAEGQPF
ncbi:MAG: ABC transporter substrate-binding protein, partial [Paracoccus sp. (in: a-proteobacteria)]|nr:ABC transporter substrate-binding protein [Paracoccus sp. (in: a-proteobacteria)]